MWPCIPACSSTLVALQEKYSSGRLGDVSLTSEQRWVRAAFFVGASLLHLLATSAIWARVADVFSSDAGKQRPTTCQAHSSLCECTDNCSMRHMLVNVFCCLYAAGVNRPLGSK